MARRKRVYSKRRRINYKRIALLVLVIILLIFLVSRIFKKNTYVAKVEEALNSEITAFTASFNTVSKVDANIYENEGIRYTNQHEGIKRHPLDQEDDVKKLLEFLVKSEKTDLVEDLAPKEDGYYWVEADIVAKHKLLFISKEKEYNFDFYYDIENDLIYVKEKYYEEFSKKYNKTKFQGYKAGAEFTDIIKNMETSGDIPLGLNE